MIRSSLLLSKVYSEICACFLSRGTTNGGPPTKKRKLGKQAALESDGRKVVSATEKVFCSHFAYGLRKVKCVFFPDCTKGADCPYFHPTEECSYVNDESPFSHDRKFPACPYGKKCLYIHPQVPCRFGNKCTRPNCNYTHPKINEVRRHFFRDFQTLTDSLQIRVVLRQNIDRMSLFASERSI